MSIKFIELATYTSPAIVEQKNKAWVEYGADNNYFQYLIDLYHASPTNNSCVKGISDLIFGQGLEVVRGDRHLGGYVEFKQLFRDEDIRRIVMDLKMLGQCALHLVKSKDRKKYVRAYHWPIQTLRPEKCNEDGEIEGYYYCADWSKLKRGQQPKRFDSFGFDKNANESILVMRPYSTGNYYFSPVDYQGGTQYAELESEIANYHINNIKNGMAPSMLINFNNGQPPQETKDMVEAQIAAKFQGSSNTGKWIISWNDGKEQSSDITPVQLSDAHNQYQFLSTECIQKVMMAHRVVSPMLLGIKDSTGLGNNADEIKTASILMDNMVIRPFQRVIIEGISQVLNANNVSLELYFKTLQPLEFTDLSGKPVDAVTEEKEYGFSAKKKVEFVKPSEGETKDDFLARCIPAVMKDGSANDTDQAVAMCYSMWENRTEMAEHIKMTDMTEDDEHQWLEYLNSKGETINDELWDLVDESPVTDPDAELELDKYEFFKRFAEPEEKSKDDKGIYLIRYRYAPLKVKDNSRQFCKNMVANGNMGVVYRREDIVKMGDEGINGQFSPKGKTTYSIWRFKGGVNCHHQWFRLTYKRKQINGKFIPLTPEEIENNTRTIDETYRRVSSQSADRAGVPFAPPDWDDAKTRPIDMPNQGRLIKK
jgi:hypothetical protein